VRIRQQKKSEEYEDKEKYGSDEKRKSGQKLGTIGNFCPVEHERKRRQKGRGRDAPIAIQR